MFGNTASFRTRGPAFEESFVFWITTSQEAFQTMRRQHNIVRLLLPVAAFGALCATGCAQTTRDPSKFDINGVRLGMGVDEVEAALAAHGSTPHIERMQFQSKLGKEPFIGAVVAMTENDRRKWNSGDHVLVLFTETEGHKAYLINRYLYYDNNTPTQLDILEKQAAEKYGNRAPVRQPSDPSLYWIFDPAGRLMPETAPAWSTCTTNGIAPDPIHVFWDLNFPQVQTKTMFYQAVIGPRVVYSDWCGVSLQIMYLWTLKGPPWVGGFAQSLADNQLQVKNLTNIKNLIKAAEAQRDEQLRKNAAKQKSPFDK
jgi:hypothetical protein